MAFAAALEQAEADGVHGLLHGAGGLDGACSLTADGFEGATQLNYLAPVLLTKASGLALPESMTGKAFKAKYKSVRQMTAAQSVQGMIQNLIDEFNEYGFPVNECDTAVFE